MKWTLMNIFILLGIVALGGFLLNAAGIIRLPGFAVLGANNPGVTPPAPTATGTNGVTGACVLSSPQTLAVQVTDADRPGTVLSSTNTVYLNSQTGQLNPGGTTTTPGGNYNVLSNTTNYFKGLASFQTDCSVSPPAPLSEKGVDTAVSTAVFNADGVTSNSVTNLTVGTGGVTTAYVNLAQSANYKHLGGVDGRFTVYINATNVTDWNPSSMSLVFDNTPCVQTGAASPAVQTATPSAVGGVIVYNAVCTGDFAPQDGSIHKLAVRIAAASSIDPGIQNMGVNFAGVDYYKNTVSGAVQLGSVKDDGSAVQAMQGATIHIQ